MCISKDWATQDLTKVCVCADYVGEEDSKKGLKQGQAENSFNANMSVHTCRAKEPS